MNEEIRRLPMQELIKLCKINKWFTLGNNDQYDTMLQISDSKNITTNDIVNIAKQIKQYSDTDYEIASICFNVAKICYSLFSIEE